MPKVNRQTAGKIGLFSAIMIIFSTLIGIGIFFKNFSVFNNNHGNPWGILISWIIAIILVMCTALSFCEISSCKTPGKSDGLGGWAQRFCGHGFGRYSKVGYALFFYALDTFVIMFFVGEACLNCFANFGGGAGHVNFGPLTVFYIFLIGAALFALFAIVNVVANNAMTKFSNAVGIIKFLPIIAVVILGITFGAMKGGGLWNNNWFSPAGQDPKVVQSTPDLVGIIISLPSILFVYEGYLIIGNIAGDMKNPEKNVPLAVVIAIIVAACLYVLITIGCITAGTGNVYELMEFCFGEGTTLTNVFTNIMSVFIFISVLGVLNAMTFTGMRAFQSNCERGELFKSKKLLNIKPGNNLFAGAISFSIVIAIWWAIMIVPSSILNTDQIIDGMSNMMILAIYIVYAVLLCCGLNNRRTKKVEVRKIKGFTGFCIVAIITCFFMISFCSIYQFIVIPLIDAPKYGWDATYNCGWGLFIDTSFKVNYWQAMVIYWVLLSFMMLCPFINDLMIKWWDKSNHQCLIWQKPNKQIVLI